MNEWVCALHVHSRHSDGSGTIAEVAAAASRAGLDAVVVTDHDTLAGRAEEGWYGDTLVLVETELSPKRRDHCLAFGLDAPVDHAGTDSVAMCDAVAAAGGFAFAAHPFSTGSAMPLVRRFAQAQRWAELERPCITGIEVWNVETEGAEQARTPAQLRAFARDPVEFYGEPAADSLAKWDALGSRRRMVGIAGADAHQKGIRVGGRVLTPLPYERLFAQVRTHVVTDCAPSHTLAVDRESLYASLREGYCFVAVDALAPARGFCFKGEAEGTRVQMGSELPAQPIQLQARTPEPALIRLLRDGTPIATTTGKVLAAGVDEVGVYRIEVRRDGRLWILSNPIYLR